MAIFILLLVVIGALAAVVSGIWVAFALGSATSKNKKAVSSNSNESRET